MNGGCLCKKVRYTISEKPISQGICYCRQCQLTGGSFGSAMILLAKDSFEIVSDGVGSYETKSDRGTTVMRQFCNSCGCHIFSKISDLPEIVTVKAATLDNFDFFIPKYLAWTQSANSSSDLPKNIPSFPGNPSLEIVLKS